MPQCAGGLSHCPHPAHTEETNPCRSRELRLEANGQEEQDSGKGLGRGQPVGWHLSLAGGGQGFESSLAASENILVGRRGERMAFFLSLY